MKAILSCLLLFSVTPAHAYVYSYTGVSNTAQVAYASQAHMRMDEHPTCLRAKCHALGWTVLWDVGAGHSKQYVEAGIGYSPRFLCPQNASVALWWASPQIPAGVREACVPKGTTVVVSVERVDGDEWVLATWQWDDRKLSRWIATPGWVNGPGVHPTKIEVYSYYNNVTPGPVSLAVSQVTLFPQDTDAFLQQTAPYLAVPDSTLTEFAVNY
jgi:hypothetical protein